MRRFSQRNSLVTLSDINITPLLDLAFVLLIIFVIISPSIRSSQEHGMDLNLPQGGGADRPLDPKDIRTVEISKDGKTLMLDSRRTSLDRMEKELVAFHRKNPNMVVFVRADGLGHIQDLDAVMDRCLRNGITRFNWRTAAKP